MRFYKKDAIAPNIQNIISKYNNVVSIPSENVRKTVMILHKRLIGNKIILIIYLIISYSSLPKSFFVSPHIPCQGKHKYQYNFSGVFSPSFAIFVEHIMFVKLLKMQDSHYLTLCINAMHFFIFLIWIRLIILGCPFVFISKTSHFS